MNGILVLSPHPDDAVWSLGGRIADWIRAGRPVTVLTVFDGTTAGPAPPGRWRAVADPALRRREDEAAVGRLGARRHSLGLIDAALRRREDGEPRYTSLIRVFGSMHPADSDLIGRIRAGVLGLAGDGGTVYAPLAAGRHVDHCLVRAAVEDTPQLRLRFYEDFPYQISAGAHAGLVPYYTEVSAGDWLAGALEYRSQVKALFGSSAALARALLARAARYGTDIGVRYATRGWQYPARHQHAAAELKRGC